MANSIFTSLLGAPLDCSGRFIGTELMPKALREAGLVQRLDIRDAGDMAVTIDSPERDPATGIIGFQSVCASSATIRAEVGALLKRGERPLVVGGCCTLLIGVAAGLRDVFALAGPGWRLWMGIWMCLTGERRPPARPQTWIWRSSPGKGRRG